RIDGELAVKLRLQVGEIWEERLGDNDRAVEAFKEVLTVDPQNIEALMTETRGSLRNWSSRWPASSGSSSKRMSFDSGFIRLTISRVWQPSPGPYSTMTRGWVKSILPATLR